ncbi:MAG: Rrf2 family transcriptional regulator [Trueperaceae bacterium]|nr:Rrf2 family transcriptional regulator [Trueperaceae bacterium]
MRLSTTDIYTFQALGYLGTKSTDTWTSSDEISRATKVGRPYLVRILAQLSAKGVVTSKKGTGGGYALVREAYEITLKEVMRAIDGPVAPLSCVSLNWHKSCVEEDRCHARTSVWQRVRDAMLEVLADVTVADLARDFEQGVNYQPCLDHLLRPGLE